MSNPQSLEYKKGQISAKRIILKGDIDEALDFYELNGEKPTWSIDFTIGYLDAISQYLEDCTNMIRKEKNDIEELIDAIRIERADSVAVEEDKTNDESNT